ncbi:MAG: hypothetical protein IPJ36_09650 [Simplicispira sp.]|nr:hypothetical protein [Simplicispira sp.]
MPNRRLLADRLQQALHLRTQSNLGRIVLHRPGPVQDPQ